MQEGFRLSKARIFGIFLLVGLLVAVRLSERHLFYDPLLFFFKTSKKQLPDYNSTKLFFGLTFRYFLNSLISLGVLWLSFKDTAVVKLSAMLLLGFFIVLISTLFLLLGTSHPSLLAVFYIRRFLLQPLFLILFLPAFYYQRHVR